MLENRAACSACAVTASCASLSPGASFRGCLEPTYALFETIAKQQKFFQSVSLWHPGRHEQDMGNDVTSQLQIVSCKGSREGLRCVSFLMLTVGQQSASHRKVQCNRDPFLLKEFYLSSRNQQHYYLSCPVERLPLSIYQYIYM